MGNLATSMSQWGRCCVLREKLLDFDKQEMECTICMEHISEETVLPCQCKLHYCQPCWDKSMANSFNQCGQARCPSCRSLVRVDYDARRFCMVFTPETIDMTWESQRVLVQQIEQEFLQNVAQDHATPSVESFRKFLESHEGYRKIKDVKDMRSNIIKRLRHQAMPAQLQILEEYGQAYTSLLEVHADARQALTKASVSDLKSLMCAAHVNSLCAVWASQNCSAPKCVCHSSLHRVGGVERSRLTSGDHTVVICDICENLVPLSNDSFVWTCENQNSTILHATSYDICDACFVKGACEKSDKSKSGA